MKLLVSLFACQTSSRFRGIGRYTFSLTKEMVKQRAKNEVYALYDINYQDDLNGLTREFNRILPPGHFLPYFHPLTNKYGPEAAEMMIIQAYQAVAPDAVLFPNIFENWFEKDYAPIPNGKFPTAKKVAIIYDIIPYLFKEHYLGANEELKNWYLDRLSNLTRFDLLLAISNATREDVITHLKIKEDKVVNISGSADSSFRKLEITDVEKERILSEFGITRPFILYIGGNDFRKNMEGALRAYSKLPVEIINRYQFVLNDVGDLKKFRSKAKDLGLSEDDYRVTGFISENRLIALYNLCSLLVFPSIYEGFGLPILEAMSCGAPVIASNSSSIPEVAGRSDILFDVHNEREITEMMLKFLTDNALREEVSAYGLERSKLFSWKEAARRAWEAVENLQKQGESRVVPISQKVSDKPKVAFVSPLPPIKSGIAQYSAELLPFLQKHFDIELYTEEGTRISDPYLKRNFKILPYRQLIPNKHKYSTVVYQLGNSHFHTQMFEMMKSFPGVAVLHDFYLSDLMASGLVSNSTFLDLLDKSHGLKAIIDFWKEGLEETIKKWPTNYDVLKSAKEVVVHSSDSAKLVGQYYSGGWRPNLNVIKQIKLLNNTNSSNKQQIKDQLGFSPASFLFCSYGLVTPQKAILEIIHAFSKSLPDLGPDCQLIFVGEYTSEDYQKTVEAVITDLGLASKVKVTGYVPDNRYSKYLSITDVAIQIRTYTRGETSRALLDCLAYGIPTIINSIGSFNDYSEQVVIKLEDPVSIDDLSDCFIEIEKNHQHRQKISQCAIDLIFKEHNPEIIAAYYADVIRKAIDADDRQLISPVVRKLADQRVENQSLDEIVRLAAKNINLRKQTQLLIDVSRIVRIDQQSGIQRVVRNLLIEFFKDRKYSYRIEPVYIEDGKLYRANRLVEKLFCLPMNCLGAVKAVSVTPGDVLLMLDSSWDLIDQFQNTFEEIKEKGGSVVTVVYDLIPLRFPEAFPNAFTKVFEHWISTAVTQSDTIVCISKSVAAELEGYLTSKGEDQKPSLEVTYFHLGADISEGSAVSDVRLDVLQLIEHPEDPFFLMVGTLEPRKGHSFALDAFEELWEKGYNYKLVIVGKEGWNISEFSDRLRHHPELGKRLIFVESPNDTEINHLYASATCLITASTAEGFGLPIVEAALHQVPVLASDIPVFREVGGEGAVYFSLETPTSLADAVRMVATLSDEERVNLAKKVKALTWKESAAWMLDILENNQTFEISATIKGDQTEVL